MADCQQGDNEWKFLSSSVVRGVLRPFFSVLVRSREQTMTINRWPGQIDTQITASIGSNSDANLQNIALLYVRGMGKTLMQFPMHQEKYQANQQYNCLKDDSLDSTILMSCIYGIKLL